MDAASSEIFDEDHHLVDRFLAGDAVAFQILYERYYPKVFHIAQGVLLDAEEAADAVQEIFTLVYRNLARFDRRSKFTTWLYRVAVNRSIQQGRAARFKYRHVELTAASERTVEPETTADPEITQAMTLLAPADRAILTLFYWDELSLSEIAASLDCNENAAKTRLFRARERFKKTYEAVMS